MSNTESKIQIKDFTRHSSDTGSSEVQIAKLTHKITYLNEHFKEHAKDFHSKTGLIKMISRRKKLLSYVKKDQPSKYQSLIQQLGLRK